MKNENITIESTAPGFADFLKARYDEAVKPENDETKRDVTIVVENTNSASEATSDITEGSGKSFTVSMAVAVAIGVCVGYFLSRMIG